MLTDVQALYYMVKETQSRRIFIMAKRTTAAAHERIDDMQVEVAEIKTEIRIQFKDLYNKIKRLEAIMIALTSASLLLLLNITFLGG
tara:strand:+ start:418 stop:678 length:261 start_codon:yes stop_codon:yes gene_type:complete